MWLMSDGCVGFRQACPVGILGLGHVTRHWRRSEGTCTVWTVTAFIGQLLIQIRLSNYQQVYQLILFLELIVTHHPTSAKTLFRAVIAMVMSVLQYRSQCSESICLANLPPHTTKLYGCSRQCSRPVLARCSMGFGPNPLINGLIQHTLKLNILFLEKFTVIHFDQTKLLSFHHKSP